MDLPSTVGQTCNDNTRTETSTAEKTGLEDGHDCETLCICEDLGWDDLIGTE